MAGTMLRKGGNEIQPPYFTSQHSPVPLASPGVQTVKRLPAMRETQVQSLGREDPLAKEMAIHSSNIAWKIPRTEDPGRLQSMGSQSWTRLSDFTFTFIVYRTVTC